MYVFMAFYVCVFMGPMAVSEVIYMAGMASRGAVKRRPGRVLVCWSICCGERTI